PGDYLRRAFALLRPGGLLYATTPNGASLTSRLLGLKWSIYAPPDHLQLFSPRSLARSCARVGFRRLRMRKEGLNPYEIRGRWKNGESGSHRVETAFELNQQLSSSPSRRLVKRALNELLSLTGWGEGLKCYTE